MFDSGSGGLTAVREIRSILPSENIIYFGDTSRVPYGGRSAEILLRYARQDVHFLRSFDVKALLVAAPYLPNALPVAAENDIPVLGVVKPSCAAAAAATRNKRVGLIATAASVRSGPMSAVWRRWTAPFKCMQGLSPVCAAGGKRALPPRRSGHRDGSSGGIWSRCAMGIDTLILGCPLSAADGDHRGHYGPRRDAHRLRRGGGADSCGRR